MKAAVYTSWVLICDSSQARIFSVEDQRKGWSLVQSLTHPQGRMKVRELVEDRQGRVQESSALGRRSAMEPPTDPKEVEAERFAGQLAALLDKGLNEDAYSRLLIAAPPHFLGLLRAQLSERVQKRLTFSLDKDYTWVDAKDLLERLGELVAPSAP